MATRRFTLPLVLALTAALFGGCKSPDTQAAASPQSGAMQAQMDIISKVTGDSPNFAQFSNGSLMSVVSREHGRGAKAGALVEWFYPHYAVDHLWDAYVGVATPDGLRWAHDMKLVKQALAPDTGAAVSVFEGPGYTLAVEDVMRPGANAHMRRVTLKNVTGAPLKGLSGAFYGFFMIEGLPGGDRLSYDPGANALVQSDGKYAVAIACDRPTDAWQLGHANQPGGEREDARQAAENNRWSQKSAVGPVPTGVNGAFRQPLPEVPPGGSVSWNYAIAIGPDAAQALGGARSALSAGWDAVRAEDARKWASYLKQARTPRQLSPEALAVYRRALVVLKQVCADNGAMLAAPTNLNPPYRFVWPRDSVFISLAMLDAGYKAEAESLFAFLEQVQQPSGGWAVNYFPDASRPLWDFGKNGNEHDQVGAYVWGVMEVFERTGDAEWLAARWPSVRKALAFLAAEQREDGLLTTCRDLWELDTDGSWTYSNGAGAAGFKAGAAIARRMGAEPEARRYEEAGARLREAILRLQVVDGKLIRGTRRGKPDVTLEAANLALGSRFFGVIPDAAPPMANTGDAIARLLTSAGGGIRRYENDPYYDGQPWPVTTGWLAIHRLERGDRAGAQALFDVMTRYAHETDALMLGEQFDEGKHRWVSAFPLAWSEATYVQTALWLGR